MKQFVNVETMVSKTYREWQKEMAPVALRAALARGQFVEDRAEVLGPARAKWDAEHPTTATERALAQLEQVAEAEGEAFDADTVKVTPLQMEMLRKIARSDYTAVNGSEPESVEDVGEVWADDVINSAADKGVFTSLLNAGLVTHLLAETRRSEVRNDNTVSLTQAGFLVYKGAAVVAAASEPGAGVKAFDKTEGGEALAAAAPKRKKACAAATVEVDGFGLVTPLQAEALKAVRKGADTASWVAEVMGYPGRAVMISGILSSLKERGILKTRFVGGKACYSEVGSDPYRDDSVHGFEANR
jgi:hypothetical protein